MSKSKKRFCMDGAEIQAFEGQYVFGDETSEWMVFQRFVEQSFTHDLNFLHQDLNPSELA